MCDKIPNFDFKFLFDRNLKKLIRYVAKKRENNENSIGAEEKCKMQEKKIQFAWKVSPLSLKIEFTDLIFKFWILRNLSIRTEYWSLSFIWKSNVQRSLMKKPGRRSCPKNFFISLSSNLFLFFYFFISIKICKSREKKFKRNSTIHCSANLPKKIKNVYNLTKSVEMNDWNY